MTLVGADSPRAAESPDVVLARMDGKLDRLFDKVNDVLPRVAKLEDRTETLEKTTLILTKNAEAGEATKIALAKALKDAEDQRRNQSEQEWTPKSRIITGGGFLLGLITLYLYWTSTTGH